MQDSYAGFLELLSHLPMFEGSFAKQLNSQELSNVIWSAAKLKDAFPKLLTVISMLAKSATTFAAI